MEDKRLKEFKVTEEILAKPEQRFLNWFLDTVMLVVLVVIFIVIIAVIAGSYGNKTLIPYLMVHPIGQYTFVSVVRLMYYISLETWFAQSVGKMVTQTVIIDENGQKPTHEVILIRTLSRLIPLYELSFVLNPKRGWHDSISRTYVVNKKLLDEQQRRFKL